MSLLRRIYYSIFKSNLYKCPSCDCYMNIFVNTFGNLFFKRSHYSCNNKDCDNHDVFWLERDDYEDNQFNVYIKLHRNNIYFRSNYCFGMLEIGEYYSNIDIPFRRQILFKESENLFKEISQYTDKVLKLLPFS